MSPYTRKLVTQNTLITNGQWLGNDAAELMIGWPYNGAWSEPSYMPVSEYMLSAFVQDDWKLSQRVSVNLGLRWEPSYKAFTRNNHALRFSPGQKSTVYLNFPSGLITMGDSGFPGHSGRDDEPFLFAPRLGVAYRLNDSGTKVLRGSYGLFYNMPSSQRDAYMQTATFPFINSFTASFNLGYPGSPEGWANWLPYQYPTNTPNVTVPANPATAVFSPTTTYGSFVQSSNTGKIHQWNLTYEDQFRPQWMYGVSYQGHYGTGLGINDYWNLPAITGPTDSWNVQKLAARRPDQRYPYYTYTYWNPEIGGSKYDSLNLKVQAHTGSLHFLSWYTLAYASATSNNAWDYYDRARPGDTKLDWGPPQASRTHNFLAAPSWDLPIFRNRNDWASRLLGGWTATPVFNVQSGAPVNLIATLSNVTYQCSVCYVRPNPTGQPYYNANWRSDPKLVYVNAAAFAQPAPTTYGTLQRNSIFWPHTKNVDMTVMKSFALYKEGVKLDLRFDFFNLFNWVTWALPATDIMLDTPASLAMTSNWTNAPRTIQVGARLAW